MFFISSIILKDNDGSWYNGSHSVSSAFIVFASGNIRVFCRVRPLLQGEMERFKRKSSVDSHGSSRPCLAEQNKRTEPKLKIEFPDSSRDGKKINFEFCSNQVSVSLGLSE